MCRLDVFPLPHNQRLTPGDTGVLDPANHHQGDEDVLEPETEDGVDGKRQQNERERKLHIHQSHENHD